LFCFHYIFEFLRILDLVGLGENDVEVDVKETVAHGVLVERQTFSADLLSHSLRFRGDLMDYTWADNIAFVSCDCVFLAIEVADGECNTSQSFVESNGLLVVEIGTFSLETLVLFLDESDDQISSAGIRLNN
jgi:hypothetical protein